MNLRSGINGRIENFDTAQEFFDFLTGELFHPENIFDVSSAGSGGWIFRGQRDVSWELYPSAFRDSVEWKSFVPQVPSTKPTKAGDYFSLGFHLHAELRAVQLFLAEADRLGIRTPIDYSTQSKGYKHINRLLADEPKIPQQFPPHSFQSAIALAQHHGVPTRLLDWTESALCAAFFAANGARLNDQPKDKQPRFGVFYAGTYSIRKESELVELVQAPRHLNNYLRSQVGLFMNMPGANKYFLNHGEWPSLEKMIMDSNSKLQIHLATLPANQAADLLRILYRFDCTPSRLMPSLDNVAQAFNFQRELFGH